MKLDRLFVFLMSNLVGVRIIDRQSFCHGRSVQIKIGGDQRNIKTSRRIRRLDLHRGRELYGVVPAQGMLFSATVQAGLINFAVICRIEYSETKSERRSDNAPAAAPEVRSPARCRRAIAEASSTRVMCAT